MGKRHKEKEENRFKYKKIIIVMFFIVLGVVMYTSVFNSNIGDIQITGNFLNSGKNSSESVDINANLSIDSIKMSGLFERVVFTSVSKNKINIEKLSPEINNTGVVLEKFDGEIVLSSEKIISLDGDADEILIKDRGLSLSDKEYDVKLEDFRYKDLKIKEVYIRKFEKPASGIIKVGEQYSDIKEKDLLIKGFQGIVSSKGLNNTIDLSGVAEKVRIGEYGFFS